MSGKSMLPYGRQCLDDDDIDAVVKVLKSDWLTTGPAVKEFENAVAAYTGAEYAVAVSSGTAALHVALSAAGIGPGDEIIVPAITFVATANAGLYLGATPVFADVEPDTLLINPASVEAKITSKTKAIIAMDYAGQPCDYRALREIASKHKLILVADAAHSLGASVGGIAVGRLADLTTFSFHPIKAITTGEGGMIVTDDHELAQKMRSFINHGISEDHHQRAQTGRWDYSMEQLGYNYRLTDIQSALGLSQLKKLPAWLKRRNEIASRYDDAFSGLSGVDLLQRRADVRHANHLYVIKIDEQLSNTNRNTLFEELRKQDIGVNVHYLPVYQHPYYHQRFGDMTGCCPHAEGVAQRILSLPIFPAMSDGDIDRVIDAVSTAIVQA